jgi:hypothetical protein
LRRKTRLETGSLDILPDVTNGLSEVRRRRNGGSDHNDRRSRVEVQLLDTHRIAAAKEGFAIRRVPKEVMRTLVSGAVRPRAGDVVLARVDRLRQHQRIELPTGRKALLNPGDEIIVACGNRYATDQFEAFVPEKLGRAHLIAAGGVAGKEAERARKMRPATEITLLGLIGDGAGVPLNLMSFALPIPKVDQMRPPVVAVLGTSMNSGKTTTARFLILGLRAAGFRVGYAKLTGTGAGNDYWAMFDSGASKVVDFTDAGLVSTYKTPLSVIETTSINLIGHLVAEGCDRIVVEVADGLLENETALLLRSSIFHTLVDRVAFAAGDAIAASAGVWMLQELGFDVACVSGLLTASPLPMREAVNTCGVPVWKTDDLANPEIAAKLGAYSAAPREAPSPSGRDGPSLGANLEGSRGTAASPEVMER